MIDLVIPKGSLEEQTLALLKKADLAVKRSSDRDYNGAIDDPRIGKVKILRPQEIPQYVEEGYFDLGITGLDQVKESEAKVVKVAELNYAKGGIGSLVKIVLAVDKGSKIKTPKQLKAGLKVSTEYPNLTRKYFKKLGLPVKIYLSYGATEAKVPEIVDAIVELTETGATLAKHGMQIIDTILEAPTVLIANNKSYKDSKKRKEINQIKALLLGSLNAEGKVLIKLNVAERKLKGVLKILPTMKNPTLSKLANPDYYAVESVVPKSEINLLLPKLKEAGARDIIELTINKVIE